MIGRARTQRIAALLAPLPWVSSFAFFVILGRVSGTRSGVLEQAELLRWLFAVGVFIPSVLHAVATLRPGGPVDALAAKAKPRFTFYALTLLGILALTSVLGLAPGPDPAAFADFFLIYLGKPVFLVGTLACLVAACLLLAHTFPAWLQHWVALSERQIKQTLWIGGALALTFGVVALGVISYYALGWAWWVGSTQ